MKRNIIFILALVISVDLFSQDLLQGFIKYNVERSYYHELPSGKKELYSTKTYSGTLFYKDKETLYKEISNESLSENQEKRLQDGTITVIPANADITQSIVYKNYEKKEIVYSFSPIQGRLGNFLKDTIRNQNWESTNEEKEINKRKCTKFILKSFFNTDWTAWIDLSVSINEGPWRFYDLPGLLVELIADNKTQKYTLQEIGIGTKLTNKSLFPEEMNTAKIYNKADYEKIEKQKKERIRLILEQNNKQNQQ